MAIHFLKALPEIEKVPRTKTLIFCLDFDGTLAPIRRDPAQVKASAALMKFLKKAVKLSHCKVVIVSGRSLKDLRGKIPVPGVILAGSHGLEWNISKKRDLGRFRKLRQFQKKWQNALRGTKGAHFESKPFSFVLHYRRCSKPGQQKVLDFFASQHAELLKKGFEWTAAHKAFEVFESLRGRKEYVSRDLLTQFEKARMVVAGDDVTDFEMLAFGKVSGWPVTVGFKRAGVKYFSSGPGEFVRLLNKIISVRESKP